ncbi:MAG: hypothetical protein V1738_02830 [Patescibacteria group bacterium]
MLWRIFIDFGWIPFTFIMLKGCWLLWVQWRQNKFAATIKTCILAIDVPRQNEQTAKAVEHIFSTLGGAYSSLDRYEKYWTGKFQPTFSFEIVSINGYVQFLVHTWDKHRDLVEAAVYAQYPDAEITEIADFASSIPAKYPDPNWNVFGTEFVLKRPNHLPLRTYFEFEHTSAEFAFKDPISSLLEVLSSLKTGEQIWFQILLTPTNSDWIKEGLAEVDKMMGKKPKPKKSVVDDLLWLPKGVLNELGGAASSSGGKEEKKEDFRMLNMSPGERNVVEAIQMKLSKTGFATKIRVVYSGQHNIFSKKRFTALKGALNQFSSFNMNELKPFGNVTPKDDYFYQRWSMNSKKEAIVRNFRNRSNNGATQFILNIEELATIYHFPMLDIKTPLLKKTDAKRAEPPSGLPMEGMPTEGFFKPIRKAEPSENRSGDGPPANLPFA